MKWIQKGSSLETDPRKALVYYYARQFCIDPILMDHLFFLGYNDEQKLLKFLTPSTKHLHDPFEMNDLKKATVRIVKAILNKENICVFGDYDVDGIASSVLLCQGLRHFGADAFLRLPQRHEGYGITPEAIEKYASNAQLIITVDNGTSAHAAMAAAKSRGIDVIVTDHHDILEAPPDCYAFLNPKRSDDTYPFQGLCGAGIALKLVQALYLAGKTDWDSQFWDCVELAALATIADLVPLQDENRAICSLGLKKMKSSPSPVLKRLFEVLKVSEIDSDVIAFQIAPLFNACGRIDDPNNAANLLLEKRADLREIKALIEINEKRRELTSQQFTELENQIINEGLFKKKVIVAQGDFHHGIIGILAARVAEKFEKPAIVITNEGVGSARSVQGSDFSIINTINRCGELLIKFGGHKAAAGLSIDSCNVEAFRSEIHDSAELELSPDPKIMFLCELPLSSFPNHFFNDLQSLEPFGLGNPKPIFYCPSTKFQSFSVFGKNDEHLKLSHANKELLAFRKGMLAEDLQKGAYIEFMYTHSSSKKKSFLIHDLRLNSRKDN